MDALLLALMGVRVARLRSPILPSGKNIVATWFVTDHAATEKCRIEKRGIKRRKCALDLEGAFHG